MRLNGAFFVPAVYVYVGGATRGDGLGLVFVGGATRGDGLGCGYKRIKRIAASGPSHKFGRGLKYCAL